jgi:flagellin-specific chaperone FliS
MKKPFDGDIFMGKLLKWMVKTDQPFSIVDNEEFQDLLEYLKKDLSVDSRRTIMRRLDELYLQMKNRLKNTNLPDDIKKEVIMCKKDGDAQL